MKRGVFLSVASATASDNSRAVLVDAGCMKPVQ